MKDDKLELNLVPDYSDSIFNQGLVQDRVNEILGNFSDNPTEAFLVWAMDAPEDLKGFVDKYNTAVKACWALEAEFDK